MKPKSTLFLLLALGFSSNAMGQNTIVFQDTFDAGDVASTSNGSLTTNSNPTGIGGGLSLYNRQETMNEVDGSLVPLRDSHNDRGNAVSTSAFSLVGGFVLTVDYTTTVGAVTPGDAGRSYFGLSAASNVSLLAQTNSTFVQNQPIIAAYEGLSLVLSDPDPQVNAGLYHNDGTATVEDNTLPINVSDMAGVSVTGTAIITVNPDSTYSVQIDGAAPSTGTLTAPFDFTETYHFYFFDQDTEFQTSLQSVTLETLPTAELSIPVISADDSLVEVDDTITFDITFDPSADTAILDIPGAVDLDLLAEDTDNDGIVQVTDTATVTHNYEVILTRTGVDDAMSSTEVIVVDPAAEAADNAFNLAIEADLPLFYYRFEDAADPDFLLDSSGNGHHTTTFAGPVLGTSPTPGGLGNASAWSESGFILAPVASELSESFTFVTMLNLSDFEGVDNRADILSMAQGTGVAGGALLSYNGEGFVTLAGGGAIDALTDASAYSSGNSCLVHFVYDADSDNDETTLGGEVRLYLNGELAGTLTATNGVNTGNWIIASAQNLGNLSPQGFVDEAALFEAVLTEAQITAHNDAFLAAADPFLGFSAASPEIAVGETAVLSWKLGDSATGVTIDGVPVTGTSLEIEDLTETTSFLIEVTGPGGPFTETVEVVVVAAPAGIVITSCSVDDSTPPMVSIEFLAAPDTIYAVVASPDLSSFDIDISDVVTDEFGVGSIVFEGLGEAEFYRVELR